MKKPYKTNWRTFGPCCICQKRLTDKRYSRGCCSKKCDDIGEANMQKSIKRGKELGKKANRPRYKEVVGDDEPLGTPTVGFRFG